MVINTKFVLLWVESSKTHPNPRRLRNSTSRLSTFHTRIFLSDDPVRTNWPSLVMVTHNGTAPLLPSSRAGPSVLNMWVDQSSTLSSLLTEKTNSCITAIELTIRPWPISANFLSHRPLSRFQTKIMRSSDPEAACLPSSIIWTDVIAPEKKIAKEENKIKQCDEHSAGDYIRELSI